MHNLKPAWQYAKAGYEYTHFMMNPDDVPAEEGQSFPTNTGRNPIDLDEKLLLKKKQVLLPFSNRKVHCKTQQTQMQGYKLHVMIHALYPEDKPTQWCLRIEDLYRAEEQKLECVRGSSEPYQQDHTLSPW